MNKLVDQYSNTYHYYINKKPLNTDYSDVTEKIQMSFKAPKLKVNDRVRIKKYKNSFSKYYTEKWSKEILFIDSVLKANPRTNKTRDLHR